MTPYVEMSPTIAALAADLALAQGELENPAKDSVNPHFKSRYADLATVRNAVIPTLSAHKLAVVQLPTEIESGPALTTMLLHASGEWIKTTMLLRPTKGDPQGIGSALTYMRRYALQAVAGVAGDEDDDGNAASRPAAKEEAPEPIKPKDHVLVSTLEKMIRAAQDNKGLTAASGAIKDNAPKISVEGMVHLRNVYKIQYDAYKAAKAKAKADPDNWSDPDEPQEG